MILAEVNLKDHRGVRIVNLKLLLLFINYLFYSDEFSECFLGNTVVEKNECMHRFINTHNLLYFGINLLVRSI